MSEKIIEEKKFEIFHKIIPLFIVIIGFWWSTQLFAHNMGYSKNLGEPWFYFKDQPYYFPYYILLWGFKFGLKDEYMMFFKDVGYPAGILSAFGVVIYVILSLSRGGNTKENLYGDADYATDYDLYKNGYLQPNGMIFGQLSSAQIGSDASSGKHVLKTIKKKTLIAYNGDVSGILIGPSGSFKGVSSVIPTLLSWKDSIIVLDTKGENFNLTAGYRRKFSHVLKYEPLSKVTNRINQIAEVRSGVEAYRDASNIAEDWISVGSASMASQNSMHFLETAKDCLTGMILHVAFCPHIPIEEKTFEKVLSIMSDAKLENPQVLPNGVVDYSSEFLKQIIEAEHISDQIHDKVKHTISRVLMKEIPERSGVISTVVRCLRLFEDPLLALNSSESDFYISNFSDSKYPISLYITVPLSDMDRLASYIRSYISFLLRRLTEKKTQHDKVANRRLLIYLDEFLTLGKFKEIEKILSLYRGYGISVFLVCQTTQQLADVYGPNHSFLSHCNTVIAFTPNDLSSAKMFSEMMGKQTKWKRNISQSGSKYDIGKKNINESGSEVQTNLLNPDQLMRLKQSELLLFGSGMKVYKGKKVISYDDPRFKDKIGLPVPETREELLKETIGLVKLEKEIQRPKNTKPNIVKSDKDISEFFPAIEETETMESDDMRMKKQKGEEIL